MSDKSVLNLSCPICKLVFKNSDSIYSTSCGHIFHYACLSSWKAQSTSCPQCRGYNPTTHRLYLNFDEVTESSSPILTTQLNDSKKKIGDLEKEVEDKRILFQNLRCESDKFRKFADGRIKYLSDIVNKLQTENQELKNTVKDVNERMEKEIQTAKQILSENSELKSDVESKEIGASEMILQSKIKILEHKLKLLTSEFEKEISKGTQMSIERTKLQCYMDQMIGADHIQISKKNLSQKSKVNKKPKQKTITCAANTLVIRKLPSAKIDHPLENVIISIARDMNYILCKEEIKTVINKTKGVAGLKELTLCVEFKAETSKMKFLLSKDLLKSSSTLQSVEITEYAPANIVELFTYANEKLRGKVFNYIAIKSNSVVAKKNVTDTVEVEIESRSHVNDLLEKYMYELYTTYKYHIK